MERWVNQTVIVTYFVDEIHRVIYVDGIYLARNVVILIARSDKHVLSCDYYGVNRHSFR